MTEWILVANAARARIFERARRRSELTEIDDLVNPDERLRGQALVSDRPGRAFDSTGAHRHAMESPLGTREKRAIDFARTVANRLEAGRIGNRFDELSIVAAPRFLGHLREQMGQDLSRVIAREISKDLTHESPETVSDRLAAG
jgi:protein required for attachment to host cells